MCWHLGILSFKRCNISEIRITQIWYIGYSLIQFKLRNPEETHRGITCWHLCCNISEIMITQRWNEMTTRIYFDCHMQYVEEKQKQWESLDVENICLALPAVSQSHYKYFGRRPFPYIQKSRFSYMQKSRLDGYENPKFILNFL